MAGPMDSRDFLPIARGNVPLEPYSLDVIPFNPALALGELSLGELRTSGFEGLEELIAEHAPEPAPAEPEPAPLVAPAAPRTKLLPVVCKPVVPAHAKIIQGFPALPVPVSAVIGNLTLDATTLRSRMVLGPNPNAPAAVVAPTSQKAVPAPTPIAATPTVNRPAPPAPVSQPVRPQVVVKPPQAPQPVAAKPVPVAPVAKPVVQPTVTVKPAVAPTVTVRPTSPPQTVPQRPAAAASAAPVQKPAAAIVQATPTPPAAPFKAAPAPVQEKPKISIRPATPPPSAPAPAPQAAPMSVSATTAPQMDRDNRTPQRPMPVSPSRPAVATREGNAVTAERLEPETLPQQAPRPKLMPIRKSEPAVASSIAVDDFPTLGMHQMEQSSFSKFWSNASTGIKAGVIGAIAAVILGAGYFVFKPSGASRPEVAGPTAIAEGTMPGMAIGGGGWASNWGTDAPVNKGRTISLYRPSMQMTDYSIEFRGQIEKKAIGWIFRASNSKNYYVAKLEMIKTGLNPIIALVKYAVIKGVEGTHTQVMLSPDFKMDTVYNVRMEVKGNKFSTYVQNKLVDYWTDDQIKTGGAGFYMDRGERPRIISSKIGYLANSK